MKLTFEGLRRSCLREDGRALLEIFPEASPLQNHASIALSRIMTSILIETRKNLPRDLVEDYRNKYNCDGHNAFKYIFYMYITSCHVFAGRD